MGIASIQAPAKKFRGFTYTDGLSGATALNTSVPSLTPTDLEMADTGIDTDGFFDPANPDQLEIPEGVSKVRVRGILQGIGGMSNMVARIDIGATGTRQSQQDGKTVSFDSGIMDVSAGDVLTLTAYSNDTATIFIGSFILEVIE